MFYCDPVFAFVGMRQLLKYKHLLARRATCAVYGRFFCHLKGTKCIHISNVQLPCSYCIHGATVHGGGDQTLEKLEVLLIMGGGQYQNMEGLLLVTLGY